MARRVHQRIIGGVLDQLENPDQREHRDERHQSVAGQRDQRQHEHRPANPDPMHDARHEEYLRQQRQQVDHEEKIAVESCDEVGLDDFVARGQLRIRVAHGQLGQDVLTGCVDPVQQDDHQRQQEQVAVGEYQGEAAESTAVLAFAREWSDTAGPGRHRGPRPANQGQGEHQKNRCHQHQQPRADRGKQHPAHPRRQQTPERGADHDDRKQALTALDVVTVGRKPPKLGRDHQPENTDPDIISKRKIHPGLARQVEQQEVDHEETRHVTRQLLLAGVTEYESVQGHDEQQRYGRRRVRVTLDFRRWAGQQQWLADGLEDVVTDHHQQGVGKKQHDASPLARPQACKTAQEKVQGGRSGGPVRHDESVVRVVAG